MFFDGRHEGFLVDILGARLTGQQRDWACGALASQLGDKRLGRTGRQNPVDHVGVEAVELQGSFELRLGCKRRGLEAQLNQAGRKASGNVDVVVKDR